MGLPGWLRVLISIHALLAESDPVFDALSNEASTFLSTLSLRRATRRHQKQDGVFGISIHALLAESDMRSIRTMSKRRHFYPRSPCGERRRPPNAAAIPVCISIHALLAESDGGRSRQRRDLLRFLSTLSLRRATTGPG